MSHDAKPIEERYRLKKFLDNDRKVLKFYCIWDDKSAGYTERRPFVCKKKELREQGEGEGGKGDRR